MPRIARRDRDHAVPHRGRLGARHSLLARPDARTLGLIGAGAQARSNLVYPALAGPVNPNLGHEIGIYSPNEFNITSHNTDRAEPGTAFVLHAQWLDPMSSGANIGDCYLVTATGYEKLTCHSPLETFRVPA